MYNFCIYLLEISNWLTDICLIKICPDFWIILHLFGYFINVRDYSFIELIYLLTIILYMLIYIFTFFFKFI